MKKYGNLWNDINTLLSMLRSFDTRANVDKYFKDIYRNEAPGRLLQNQIEKLQKRLDDAK